MEKIPFNPAVIKNDYYDEELNIYTIDCFPEDHNAEGFIFATVDAESGMTEYRYECDDKDTFLRLLDATRKAVKRAQLYPRFRKGRREYWSVANVSRSDLYENHLDDHVDDETMHALSQRMGRWFDDYFQQALLECAEELGINKKTGAI